MLFHWKIIDNESCFFYFQNKSPFLYSLYSKSLKNIAISLPFKRLLNDLDIIEQYLTLHVHLVTKINNFIFLLLILTANCLH